MIYQIQMEYIPLVNTIWVSRLSPEDPIYEYDNLNEAQAKATELQEADQTGRQYRVVEL
jgi:hypothetical protein